MAITEPRCGSDTAAIQTTAVRDGDHWVLNGEKIFVTSGHKALVDSQGFVVVWATVDRSGRPRRHQVVRGRGGHAGHARQQAREQARHPRQRHRVARVRGLPLPLDNLLGSAEVADRSQGLQGRDGDVRRHAPVVAASALGVARAALELRAGAAGAPGIEVRYDRAAPPAQPASSAT